ncbi:DUF4397 domain-containing protein [Phycicoccus avicenniae]|uniref:DUF4397 domain-containing protein n=1 Tax=Phycicoccus avicenniae TaxID=2828860 RepID=UPI003D27ECB1
MQHRTPSVVFSTRALLVLAAAVGLGATAVAPAAASAPASAGTAAMGTAWVRAAHLVPGLGTMSISLVPFAGSTPGEVTKPGVPAAPLQGEGRVLAPAADFGSAGDYRQVPEGLYNVEVRPIGAAADTPPLLTGTVDAVADRAYTAAVLGPTSSPQVQVLTDDLRPPEPGTARVRLLAAATGAATVTVRAQDGPTVAEDAAFGRLTAYAVVPDGRWTLDVTTTATGTGTTTGGTARGTVDVASGGVYTLLVVDAAGGGVRLLPLVDAQGVPTAPKKGVQTGLGGAAERPADPALGGGLALAGAGATVLVALGARRRVAARSVGRVLGRAD